MHKVHLKYGITELVRKGYYSAPTPCQNPNAKFMTLNLDEVTCGNCNKMIDSWGRDNCSWTSPGIILINEDHWPERE